ncbi:hypothetical protein [Vibrio phage RYC]|nr:hypothetical protein [Vibrio phage RYC]
MIFVVTEITIKETQYGPIPKYHMKSKCGNHEIFRTGVVRGTKIGDEFDHYVVPAVQRLVERLGKIGISIELSGNLPFIYLETVNGTRVSEKNTQHGFTIGYSTSGWKLTNPKETFKLIRRYCASIST